MQPSLFSRFLPFSIWMAGRGRRIRSPQRCEQRSEPVEQPENDHQQHEDRRGENRENHGNEAKQEGPVAPGVAMRLAQVANDEAVVAAIGFPRDVEEIAEERDGADDDTEAEVDRHAQERDVRDAANPRSEDEDGGGEAGEHVAEAGNEADEAVEPDADGRAGDAEPVVEQVRVEVEILVGEELLEAGAQGGRSAARRQNFRVGRRGHDGARAFRRSAEAPCCNATIEAGMAAIVQRQNA
jgi:hypothetical protein